MNTTAHEIAPEAIMAFLDGELPPLEAEILAAHLAGCTVCSTLEAGFRHTSAQLAAWTVPDLPRGAEHAILASARKSAASSSKLRVRAFYRWKHWSLSTIGGGAAFAASLIFLALRPPASLLREVRSDRQQRQDFTPNPVASSPPQRPVHPSMALQRTVPYAAAAKAMPRAAGVAGMSGGVMGGIAMLKEQGTPLPMIARAAALTVVVSDLAASRPALDAITERHHGYPAEVVFSGPENVGRTLQASLRIPATELDAAVKEYKTLGYVESESVSGEEVGQQHQDLVARLKTARETEERFQSILRQRTGSVADVLEVEEGIARVRGEIEGMEAEQAALEHRVDFATVNLLLKERYKAQLAAPADTLGIRMHNALIAGYRNATEMLIGFVLNLEEYGPVVLIWMALLGVPLFLLWRRSRRSRNRML